MLRSISRALRLLFKPFLVSGVEVRGRKSRGKLLWEDLEMCERLV